MTTPTAYPTQQQMSYPTSFNPRPNSFPYSQAQQYPPHQQQQPYSSQGGGYPSYSRSQPQYFQHSNTYGNLQSPTANGGGGALSHSGTIQAVDGISAPAYSAPPYNQSVSSSSIPSSLPQAVPSSFQDTTSAPQQQSAPAMAAPPQLASPNTPTSQQKPPVSNGAYPVQQQTQAQPQLQGQGQGQGFAPPLSPKSATREKLRVTILLEINSHLLQEIISLQQQGKAGLPGQPSPTQETSATSPTSATDPHASLSNSPVDPSKPASSAVKQQPSQECADCMRRLQANLSYLAAVADRHKRPAGTFPASPAIMTPPSHLQGVRDLYKKLNAVFPGALQTLAKQNQMSMAQAQAQTHSGIQTQAANPGP